jgi:hypothetical protein
MLHFNLSTCISYCKCFITQGRDEVKKAMSQKRSISLIDTLYAVVAVQDYLISLRSNSVPSMAQLSSIAHTS